jgi:hypothetical protein
MKIASLAVVLAAMTFSAAAAPAPQSDAPIEKSATAAGTGKMKCTRERITGSNRTVRLCVPEAQAKTMTTEEKVDLIRSQHNGTTQSDD